MSDLPNNLPADVSRFVGRRAILRQATERLSSARLMTLTGAGGVGKTRLALKTAHEVKNLFPDGAWFVDLAELSGEAPDCVPYAVASTLGVRDLSTRPASTTLTERLHGQRVLLVLDNCEHLVHPSAVFARALLRAVPGLQVLATSREPLGVEGESLLPVPPLTLPAPGSRIDAIRASEAVTLFSERAEAIMPGFTVTADNAEQVADLCRQVEGLPLAIELAAAWLPSLSINEIRAQLDRHPYRILSRGSRSAPARHQSLENTIGWSAGLCTPQERCLWAQFSAVPGGFDRALARQVFTIEGVTDIDALVAGMVEKSLLIPDEHDGQSRYGALPAVRQFGRERLTDEGTVQATLRRLRDYFIEHLGTAEADWFTAEQTNWIVRIQRERANILAVLEFCAADAKEARAGLILLGYLWPYWIYTFHSFREGREWLRRLLDLDPGDSAARAKALWVYGWFSLRQGEVADALPALKESREMARGLGDETLFNNATHVLGLAAYLGGDTDEAAALLDEALRRCRSSGDRHLEWMTLFHLAIVQFTRGETEHATNLAEQCLALCESQSAFLSKSNALWLAGLAGWIRGEQNEAAEFLLKGLRTMRTMKDLWGIAECLEVLAWITAAQRKNMRAAHLFGAANSVWRSIGSSMPVLRPFAESHSECEHQLRKRLGDSNYLSEFRAGTLLTVCDAVRYALEEPLRYYGSDTHAASDSGGTDLLTPRELQVARLICSGATNKDIALKLVISTRTVEVHVSHILEKLELRNRLEIATWVSRLPGPLAAEVEARPRAAAGPLA